MLKARTLAKRGRRISLSSIRSLVDVLRIKSAIIQNSAKAPLNFNRDLSCEIFSRPFPETKRAIPHQSLAIKILARAEPGLNLYSLQTGWFFGGISRNPSTFIWNILRR